MGQEQFKVTFSLKSKLLISVVLLLIIVIAFLNLSTIILLKEDKRAYIYQSQATEAVLAGKEFTFLANQAIDTLRISLASINPETGITRREQNALQSVLDNQLELATIRISTVQVNTTSTVPLLQVEKKGILEELKIESTAFVLTKEELERAIQSVMKDEFAFINISRVGSVPILAVAIGDLKLKDRPEGMPLAFGFIPLHEFLKDLRGANITISSQDGWVLYDSDPAVLFGRKNIQENPLFKASYQTALSTGAQEFLDGKIPTLGSFYKPGYRVSVFSKMSLKRALRSADVLTAKFVVLAGMAIGAAIIFALLFARNLTAPIKKLYEATKEVAAGKFDLRLDISSKDEIGALSTSFTAMSQKISELIKESMEKVRLEGELAVATAVQQALIPPSKHESKFVQITSHYQSAGECGGDWWGLFTVGNKIALMIADATGHGVPSALITAAARSCFSVMHKLAQENPNFPLSPSEMLKFANRAIFESSSGKIMMTFFISIIDFDTYEMTYSSAGHNPPWLFKKNGSKYTMKSLTAKGSRLGERPDSKPYLEKTIKIDPEDILFLYTDGILEGTNRMGVQYGKKQVRKVIEPSLHGGPDMVVNNLIKDFMKHNGAKPLDDDVTLATALILPPPVTPNA